MASTHGVRRPTTAPTAATARQPEPAASCWRRFGGAAIASHPWQERQGTTADRSTRRTRQLPRGSSQRQRPNGRVDAVAASCDVLILGVRGGLAKPVLKDVAGAQVAAGCPSEEPAVCLLPEPAHQHRSRLVSETWQTDPQGPSWEGMTAPGRNGWSTGSARHRLPRPRRSAPMLATRAHHPGRHQHRHSSDARRRARWPTRWSSTERRPLHPARLAPGRRRCPPLHDRRAPLPGGRRPQPARQARPGRDPPTNLAGLRVRLIAHPSPRSMSCTSAGKLSTQGSPERT
jgi:hypothetical protein